MRSLLVCCVMAVTVLLPLVPLSAQTERSAPPDRSQAAQELGAFFRSSLDSFQLVGISAGVIRNGRLTWSEGYGVGNRETGTPVTPDMLFNIGSASKTVTVAALMHLWEQGKFALDDDINSVLSFRVRNPRFPDRPVTFRMLMTHTSSISDMRPGYGTLPALTETEDSERPLEEVLRSFLVPGGTLYADSNFSAAAPGERYEYSNLSFSLLGHMVERISGKKFTVYCRESLFDPLRMERSTWRLADLDQEKTAFTYRRDPKTGENTRKLAHTTWTGYMDGGLYTSITEFSNFLVMMASRGSFEGTAVLKPATVDTILALQHVGGAPPGRGLPTIGHALLWILSRAGPYEVYQMNGFGPSFFAEVYFDPRTRNGGAFFTSGEFSSFPAMGKFIMGSLQRLMTATERL